MSDLLDDPRPGENAPEFSVSEISGAIKKTLEGEFGRVRVRGEVGRVVHAKSGHLYFDVKDDRNSLSCTTWKGQKARLSILPEEGMEVVVTGKVTAYGPQSKYNMNVDDVVVAGEGALMAMLEKRKKMLAAEGLFDLDRKRPIPYLPEIIGVVTSPSGAVIRDILHRLRNRFPRKVLVWPVAVQGQNCAPEVARAIEGFNGLSVGGAFPRPDLIIVARGGGSIEDLWGFNEEIVARAAAASDIPLISAVGHETDTTLIDFVSDQRAPTPTAAAELSVPVRLDLVAWVDAMGARATQAMSNNARRKSDRLADLARVLPKPEQLLTVSRQRLDGAVDRLPLALRSAVAHHKLALNQISATLKPNLLRKQVENLDQRLGRFSDRLTPEMITRDTARKGQDVARLARDLNRIAKDQMSQAQDRLGRAERLRQTLGYEATLQRGYAVVRDGTSIVTQKSAAESATDLEIQFADGRVKMGAKPKKKKGPETPEGEQQSLF